MVVKEIVSAGCVYCYNCMW